MDERRTGSGASWALNICVPSGFFCDFENRGRSNNGLDARCLQREPLSLSRGVDANVYPEQALLDVLNQSLMNIVERWKFLCQHVNAMFGKKEYATFMNPEAFVHLLYDKATFPRFRFYFWAIGCLSAFEENIATNLRVLRVLRELIRKTKRKS
jgi:hypothetical protein